MCNSQLSLIANYSACLLEPRDLVDLFLWQCVCTCVPRAFNDGGRCSLFRYVYSLVRPEGVVGLGELVCPSASINTHRDPIQRQKCACLCVCVVYVCARLRDAAAVKRARGYYCPVGLLWRPVVSERSNICGVFVKAGFPLSVFVFSLLLCQCSSQKITAWDNTDVDWSSRAWWKISSLSALVLSNIGKHGTWMWSWFKSWRWLSCLCSIMLTVGPQAVSVSRGLGDSFHWAYASGKHTFWGSI